MNSLNINHIKVEKANAIKFKYQKLRKVTSFFRVFEIFVALAVISRLSFQVPSVISLGFKVFYEYFQYLSLLLVSPHFVFIVGNAIVITLFINSGHLNTPCEVKLPKSPQDEEKITKHLPNKQEITEENAMMATVFTTPPPDHHHQAPPPSNHRQAMKVYHRSKSEKLKRQKTETSCCSLRRLNTEVMKSLKVKIGCCEEAREGHYPEDHMSNEDFRKTIEDFIARQQRFLREEEEFSALESNFDL